MTAPAAWNHLVPSYCAMARPSTSAVGVARIVELMRNGLEPTAVAIASLDVCEPASPSPTDTYTHWGLTHFRLDGHHTLQAAAQTGAPLTLLSLVARDGSLADAEALEE